MIRNACFTSESVTEGHPDKLCDQIADRVLDTILSAEPEAHVACEVAAAQSTVMVMGETTASVLPDLSAIVRRTIEEIGYGQPESGFDLSRAVILSSMHQQSPDIRQGVDNACDRETPDDPFDRVGAGDQGMMTGYACDETVEDMPMAIYLAHKLTKRLTHVRKSGELPWLRPDGKSQVTIRYDEQGKPVACPCIVVSAQHMPEVSHKELEEGIRELVIAPEMPKDLLNKDTRIWINPTGRFVCGGPEADSGLTGRKIIVDTYGGYVSHGGGSFSGKDASKVDRTGAYMARYIAKNLVDAGLCRHCTVQLAYAIGVARPVSVYVNTEGTGVLPDAALTVAVNCCFDMRPAAMIEKFQLKTPQFNRTSCYGHFGRSELRLPWEETDKVDVLAALKKIKV